MKSQLLNIQKKKKQIIDNKPNTRYVITALGKKVFGEHITALEGLLRQLK